MKIEVTGASGFVGKNLINFFNEKSIKTQPLPLRTRVWQKRVPKEADALIHLAGKAHDTKNTTSEDDYYQINTDLTIDVFEAFLKSDIRDFIYFSSVKAVADTEEDQLSEKEEPNPLTPYGKSKLKAEQYLFSQKLPPGRRLFIIRPCMIHGPENKGNLNLLYKLVSKGIPWPLGAFENKRSFCSIDNLLFIIKELIEQKDILSGVYNVSDDEPLSSNEVVSLLSESQNRNPRIWKVSKGLIHIIAKAGNLIRLPLNEERLRKLTDSYVVSNQKIKKAIGKPLPVSSKEGLLNTFKSFQ